MVTDARLHHRHAHLKDIITRTSREAAGPIGLHCLMSDLDTLTDSQREALSQLQAVTERSDVETQLGVLKSVDWDVQV